MLLSVAPFGGLGKLGTQLNLNTNIVGDIRVPVPPLDEQRVIADFLDRETARIDQLIGKTKLLLRLAGENQSAAIHSLVTGKIGHNDYKDLGCPWFGRMPSHWQTVELRRLIKPGTSITYGIVQAGPKLVRHPLHSHFDMAGEKLPPGGYARTSPEITVPIAARKYTLATSPLRSVRQLKGRPSYLDGKRLKGPPALPPASSIDPEFLRLFSKVKAHNSAYSWEGRNIP